MGSHLTLVPDGSFTKAQYMTKYGCRDTKARQDLNQMVDAGKLLKTIVQVTYYTPNGPGAYQCHSPAN